ncbi:Hcp family type VI secretion system effector [Celerinatantimonas sp. MCCC 1A17872]|uniref:Hcp family type VI secretion system effector n=1 Tax=Celerinatantimonas sp. MCCC 1A17872 TaxID=3177514 RepID=UPI0038C26DE3
MANVAYLSVIGENQGTISQGCNTQDSIGNHYQTAHQDEITVLSWNHQLSRGLSAQSQQHHPLQITKRIDKASPMLAMAWSRGERLTCELKLYRTNSSGLNECYYVITLKNAEICAINHSMPHVHMSDADTQEIISFKYKNIDWEHKITGTSGYDDWDDKSWATQ